MRDLILSQRYQDLWGDRFSTVKVGEHKIENDRTGWKFASSEEGVGTGERGDRVIPGQPPWSSRSTASGARHDGQPQPARWSDRTGLMKKNQTMLTAIATKRVKGA
jgi:hypothetical protein